MTVQEKKEQLKRDDEFYLNETVQTTIRVPRRILNKVKHLAVDKGCSQQVIIWHALEDYLKKVG